MATLSLSFFDARTGAPLLSGAVSVALELLLGKSWINARDTVVIPAYMQARARQELQSCANSSRGSDRGGSADEPLGTVTVKSWAVNNAEQAIPVYDFMLSPVLLTPGSFLTVRLLVEPLPVRRIGEAVEFDAATRELTEYEQHVVRKHVQTDIGCERFDVEWRPQLPKARGRRGGAPKGKRRRSEGAAPQLVDLSPRAVTPEIRAKRSEVGKLGAKKRWEKASRQRELEQSLQEGTLTEPTALWGSTSAVMEDDSSSTVAPEPEPAPKVITLTAVDGRNGRSVHAAYAQAMKRYGMVWFRCKVCNVEVAGARNAVAHSKSIKCRRAVYRRQSGVGAVTGGGEAPKWLQDVFPETAGVM